jgi:uncharacterized protein YheU (UPF0270 family)
MNQQTPHDSDERTERNEHNERTENDGRGNDEKYVIVPFEELSAAALESLLEEYITREGTDYGERVFTLDEKKRDLRRLLDRREVVIVFDPEGETSTLRRRVDLPA